MCKLSPSCFRGDDSEASELKLTFNTFVLIFCSLHTNLAGMYVLSGLRKKQEILEIKKKDATLLEERLTKNID